MCFIGHALIIRGSAFLFSLCGGQVGGNWKIARHLRVRWLTGPISSHIVGVTVVVCVGVCVCVRVCVCVFG